MHVKRHYDWAAPRHTWTKNKTVREKPLINRLTGEPLVTVDAETGEKTPIQLTPPITHVTLQTMPVRNKFSENIVADPDNSWIWLQGETIRIRTDKGEVVYRIDAMPGRYCCHCGEKLPDDDLLPNGNKNPNPTGAAARAHVLDQHPGDEPGGIAKSPDPENPAGYRCPRFYDCTLEG